MTLPIIHMNGTGAETLRDDALRIARALRDVEDAFGKAEFNARDYYCHPDPSAWDKAREERHVMLRSVRSMIADMMAQAEHAQGIISAKEARR
jgi:hypothetical protein